MNIKTCFQGKVSKISSIFHMLKMYPRMLSVNRTKSKYAQKIPSTSELTFVISSLASCRASLFWEKVYSKNVGANSYPYRKGSKTI